MKKLENLLKNLFFVCFWFGEKREFSMRHFFRSPLYKSLYGYNISGEDTNQSSGSVCLRPILLAITKVIC